MRPHQWIKNGFVFAALVFSGRFKEPEAYPPAVLMFLGFCLVSGGLYLVNDLVDIELDKLHPEKRMRPLASGRLSPRMAVWAATAFIPLGLTLAFVTGLGGGLTLSTYVALTLAYSFFLKQYVFADVLLIATGFVLRAAAGALAIDVTISRWLIVCTALLALFLALNKRRHELLLLGTEAAAHRANLETYSTGLLNVLIALVTVATFAAYTVYCITSHPLKTVRGPQLLATLPFVVYGMLRYLYLANSRKHGGDPTTTLITDRQLLTTVVLWLLTVGTIVAYYG